MVKILLLGTAGCHLCEEAKEILTACSQIIFENIDIAEQEQWQERYAIRIPVLFHPESKNELGWPFTLVDVQNFIMELSND